MKKFFAMLLVSVAFMGSAFASDLITAAMDEHGVLHPMRGYCEDEDTTPTPSSVTAMTRYCDHDNFCPPGYDKVAKYCWDNGSWQRCGFACQDNGQYSGPN
ncbi:MAG: hypothetical protein HUU57_06235 [Bdellovibrio sp.]|nr:hypothetical protein [Bdellovibrio sp.]